MPYANMNVQLLLIIHDGYRYLGILHRRRFYKTKNQVVIEDELLGNKTLNAVARIHFAANITPRIVQNNIIVDNVVLHIQNAKSIKLGAYQLAEQYNVQIAATCAEVIFEKKITTIIEL
jgi:uncharacterized heparinase superfamily protein